MKKLFIVLAVATLGFVACNNESASEETQTPDSSTVAPTVTPDSTTVTPDSTTVPAADSTSK